MDENKFLSNQRKKVDLSQNDIGEQLWNVPKERDLAFARWRSQKEHIK